MAAAPASPKNALGRKRMSNVEYSKIAYSKQAGKTLDEIREKGIEQFPHTLRGSLEALIRDNEYLRPVMSPLFIDTYQHFKFETQVWPYEARPTAFEFATTYSC